MKMKRGVSDSCRGGKRTIRAYSDTAGQQWSRCLTRVTMIGGLGLAQRNDGRTVMQPLVNTPEPVWCKMLPILAIVGAPGGLPRAKEFSAAQSPDR
jgi:hypothetical protein